MKKALVVVSFGTTYPAARRAIENIENTLRAAKPEYDFFRSFTSSIVVKRIWEQEQVQIPQPDALAKQLLEQGYEEVIVQCTHMIPGIEFEKMQAMLAPYAEKFKSLKIGAPLLSSEKDVTTFCEVLMRQLPAYAENEGIVLMGHGSEHIANAVYAMVENALRAAGHERVYVGTVEGFPTLDYVIGRLEKHGVRKVWLAPMMIVAGDHAQNDMAGDDEDSWSTQLAKAGIHVTPILKGLGEYQEIATLFLRHLPA